MTAPREVHRGERLQLINQKIHGNLLIKSLLGEGAIGAVFLAENLELPDRKYAVKVLLNPITDAPTFLERFSEEARNQAALDHPNIVRVYDYFKENGRYFMVVDYVDGKSLDKIIQESGKLDEKRAIEIMDGVLRGLDFAHQHGIVHRDVKPSNIIVDSTGRARLTDFGIAIRAGEMRLTGDGLSVIGTAAYMSPEQIRTPAQIDHRADVYSAGIVLYEMLTGDVPFHGDTEFAVYQHQVTTAPPDPRSVNKAVSVRVSRIVSRALAKDPGSRIQGCEQFRRMLAREADAPRARIKPKHLLLIAAPAAALLAAILLVAPPFASRPATGSLTAPVRIPGAPEDPAKAHDLALAALQSLSLVCRESAAKQKKEEGKRLAEQIPDSAIAEGFQQQIAEAQQNIADFSAQYRDRVRQLAAIETSATKQPFEGIGTDSRRAAYVAAIERDVQATRAALRASGRNLSDPAGDAASGALNVCDS